MPIAPYILAAQWLLNQAGGKLFNTVADDLAVKMGMKSPPLTESKARNLLDDYSQRLQDVSRQVIDRLDQDRLAKLRSAIDQLKRAPRTASKREALADALSKFSEVTHVPEQGQTGGFPNAQLRSIAFLGIAAVHLQLQDSKGIIAENIAAAVYADSAIAEQWLGKDTVWKLLQISSPERQREAERLIPRVYQLNRSGSHREAVDVCNQVIALHPEHTSLAKAYRNKAWALNALGQHKEALDACEQAINLDPSAAAYAYNNKAWALNALGRYEEALRACRQALSIRHDADLRFSVHGQMKWALNALGRHEEAGHL